MRHARWAVSSLVLATILTASTARAQDIDFYVMPYGGVFFFDDDELTEASGVEVDIAAQVGARVGFALGSWAIEGGYGYASLSTEASEFVESEFPEEEIADLEAHLLYGAINYFLAYEDNPTALMLSAGVGTLTLDPEGEDEGDGDTVLELGVGFTHPVRDWIKIRGDARDHMTFCKGPRSVTDQNFACPRGDKTMHHFEVSAGIEFFLF